MNIARRPKLVVAHAKPIEGSARLGRAAERLLRQLGEPGAYALSDPIDAGMLILRSGGEGVSLGRGRCAGDVGESLLRAGLVEREGERQQRLVISKAGRARLRREDQPGDTAFLAQHLDLMVERRGEAPVLRDASESPLAWMARRRGRDGAPMIDAAAFAAGERLRRDLTQSAMLPQIGADWSRVKVDGGGPRDPAASSDRRVAAKDRVDRALVAVGADLSGLLIDLCGFLKGLEQIESERGWPARSAKVVARIALGRLAEHYGLAREATGPDRSRTRLWRAAP
jgi:hypothetical protein